MKYLDLAARLASEVDWRDVYPNPRVGCVIVRDGEVLATGVHERCGGAHAEVAAIASLNLSPGLSLAGAATKPGLLGMAGGLEVYVTLEPCDHFEGKRTGSCTQKLLDLNPAKVVIGAIDVRFSGKNVEKLRAAGIVVEVVNHAASSDLARLSPRVILKLAQTLDGKIAISPEKITLSGNLESSCLTLKSRGGASSLVYISSLASRKKVHQLRLGVDAILTTTGTILSDDPILDCRLVGENMAPDLVVFGKSEIKEDAKIYQFPGRKVMRFSGDDLAKDLREISEMGIKTILTECGAMMATSLLRECLVDELLIFIAPKVFGSGMNVFSEELDLSGFEMKEVEVVGGDLLVRMQRK